MKSRKMPYFHFTLIHVQHWGKSKINSMDWYNLLSSKWHTAAIEIIRPGHNIRMYFTNFWRLSIHLQQNILGKNLYKSLFFTSLRFFWYLFVRIGQLFETQCLFEVCLEIDKSLSSKGNVADFGILPNI